MFLLLHRLFSLSTQSFQYRLACIKTIQPPFGRRKCTPFGAFGTTFPPMGALSSYGPDFDIGTIDLCCLVTTIYTRRYISSLPRMKSGPSGIAPSGGESKEGVHFCSRRLVVWFSEYLAGYKALNANQNISFIPLGMYENHTTALRARKCPLFSYSPRGRRSPMGLISISI